MKRLRLVLPFILVLALPLGVSGQRSLNDAGQAPLLEVIVLDSLVSMMQESGYAAKTGQFKSGRDYISSSTGGTSFQVTMYDCEGAVCEDIQFAAWFGTSYEGTVEDANAWNLRRRHAKAVYDPSDNTVGLYMDITLVGGVTRAHFEEYLSLWDQYLGTFKQYLSDAH